MHLLYPDELRCSGQANSYPGQYFVFHPLYFSPSSIASMFRFRRCLHFSSMSFRNLTFCCSFIVCFFLQSNQFGLFGGFLLLSSHFSSKLLLFPVVFYQVLPFDEAPLLPSPLLAVASVFYFRQLHWPHFLTSSSSN